jgi:subtilisin family serine protease
MTARPQHIPKRRWHVWTALALAVLAPRALAQVALPSVRLPDLPILPTEELNTTLDGVLRTADPRQLRELRRLRVRELLRTNRAALEADPRGAPILRSEVVALSPTQEALDRARQAGFAIGRTRTLEGLDVSIVVLQAPPGMSTRRALRELREADPQGTYDYNHVYQQSGLVAGAAQGTTDAGSVPADNAAGSKVGLIDAGIQRSHPVFAGVAIHEQGCAGAPIPSAHGTAVASLMVGRAEQFEGAAPGAELYAADVYCGLASGGAVDAIADALAWLSRGRVPVINISLVGPHNALLEQMIRIVTARGHVVVAAVGNDGPSAPPLYPAAYPQVIGVTGVDAKRRVLLEACRGKHVAFAAPGANISAAGLDTAFAAVRGTSFAAPIVAGLLARSMRVPASDMAQAAVATLETQARDLGTKGRDKIYGAGLVGDAIRPDEALAKSRPESSASVK